MLKRVVLMSEILSVVLVASMAGAYTVDLKYLGVQPQTGVNIYAGDFGNTGVYAGNLQIQFYDGSGPTFLGFCVEPRYPSNGFATYNLSPIDPTSRYAAAAWVLDQYHAGEAVSTAAQIAVWELVWDTSLNWDDGTFKLLGTTENYDALKLQATTIYNAALGATITGSLLSKYMLASDGVFGAGYQDFVVQTPAPIPAAVWLLGSGLIGLAVIRRRMKK